jgi:putative spermidine/putrescine transport system substrate-binding protein
MTGWADTWMISANAPHPNCMLSWMKYSLDPKVQAEVEYWYGAAGSNTASCADLKKLLGKDADLADTLRYGYCGDADFLNALYLWKTPQANCGDSRGDTCVDYSVWQQKWTEIRGA